MRAQTALMWAVIENHTGHGRAARRDAAPTSTRRTTVTMPKGEYVPGTRRRRVRDRHRPAARACRRPNGGMTPLLFAVRDGNVAMTRLLLDRGADHRSVVRQSTLRRCSSRCSTGRSRWRPSCSAKGANPNARRRLPPRPRCFAAIDLRNFNHESVHRSLQPTDAIRWI